MKKILFVSLWLGIVLGSCDTNDDEPLLVEDPPVGEVEPAVLESALGTFGWEVVRETVRQSTEPQNTIVSPISIAAALYMAYNGADSDTRTAMDQALKLNGLSKDSLNAAVYQLFKLLENTGAGVQFTSANAVFWDETRMTPFEDFLSNMTSYYGAETFAEDFQRNPEAVLADINTWVNTKTQGRIEKILEELSPEEIMFLVNALYFIGDWEQPFDDRTTSDQVFTLSTGEKIRVPTMNQDNKFTHYEGLDFRGVACPFVDTNYAMWFVLPPEDQSIDDFLSAISYEKIIDGLTTDATHGRILLHLPRFEVNYKIQMNEVLKAMGMEMAFDPDLANFSQLGTPAYGNPYISRVEHKIFLKIDEKGAEGAAVTAVGIGIQSLPPVFRFDRPFLVLLMHRPTQTPIFVGKIENPLEE